MRLVLALTLFSLLAAAEPPVLGPEVTLGMGGDVFGSSASGPFLDSGALHPRLEARGNWGGFVLEASAGLSAPIASALQASTDFGLRLGWSNERFAIVGGGWLQWAPTVPGVQILPVLRLQYAPGPVVLTLGVFDFNAQAPAHLSVAYGPLELGYVAPFGGQGTVRIPLRGDWGIRFQVIGVNVLGARQIFFNLTAVYGSKGGRWW